MSQESSNDPLEFVRNMWKGMGFNLPGMVTPTMDVDELDQRIADMKAVEGWLKMNLNMLQMSIQGLEMQRATLMTIKHMGDAARRHAEGAPEPEEQIVNPFTAWPWMHAAAAEPEPAAEEDGEDTSAQNAEAAAKAAQAAGDAANAFATAAAAATNAAASAAMWPFQMMEHAGKDGEAKAPAKKAAPRKTASGAKRTTTAKPAASKPAARKTGTAAKKPAATTKTGTRTTARATTPKK